MLSRFMICEITGKQPFYKNKISTIGLLQFYRNSYICLQVLYSSELPELCPILKADNDLSTVLIFFPVA